MCIHIYFFFFPPLIGTGRRLEKRISWSTWEVIFKKLKISRIDIRGKTEDSILSLANILATLVRSFEW